MGLDRVAATAGRVAELMAAADLVGEPLPRLTRNRRESEPLRIVYLMPSTGPGGGARVLFEHANHLWRLGAQVTVVSHFPRPEWFDLETDFVEVPFGRALSQSIAPCDVIVAGYWDEILPARLLGIAPVVHFEQGDFHLYDEVPSELKAVVEASLAAADWTITVGEAARDALAERYGVFASRIENAVDKSVFHPGAPSRNKTVLFMGWDGSTFKGLDVARDVAAGLMKSHPEVRLRWITPHAPVGPAIGETVVAPSQSELACYVREASVYVGTSRYESFPLPPLEAMASSTPVVSTANRGILAYGRDGENCLLVPVDDPVALLHATRRVLDDEELSTTLSTGGLKTAASFEWSVIAASLMVDLRSLAENLPPSPEQEFAVQTDELVFENQHDRSLFLKFVRASPYEKTAVPVSQPVYGDYRLVRWRVVVTKTGGIPGVARAYLPARCEVLIEDSPYQFGVELLREELFEEAFSWFVCQCQQAPHADQAVVGRWAIVSLIEAGRADDAMDLAGTFAATHPSYPDYYLLMILAARAAHRTIDLDSPKEAIRLLGGGARYDEWFDRPAELLERHFSTSC